VKEPAAHMAVVAVRVRPGLVIHRHGRAWSAGQVLSVEPDDAKRLVARRVVERVRV
jgi:hypothetical protein